MSDATCIAIFGQRGSGKTTRTRALIAQGRRVVVFDPIGEYARSPGFAECRSLREVLKRLKAGWGRGFRIAYVPSGDHPRMLHGLASMLWQAQEPYERGIDRRQVLLVVEEMNLGYPVSKLPAGYTGMSRATLQGRHRGINVIGVSQRPALVSADFRGQVAETYALKLATAQDLDAICRVYGREHEPALRGLKEHEWLRFAGGTVARGKNRRR